MNIYLLNVGELIAGGSQEQFDLLLERLDETRRKKVLAAKTPKTRAAALGAGLLLQKAVRDWRRTQEGSVVLMEQSACVFRLTMSDLSLEREEPLSLSYRCGERGKPYFQELPLYFSLSHSGDYVLCAVDEREIGADLQRLQAVDEGKLARRFFSEPERLLLEHCESAEERQSLFFEFWTRKEAYGKLTGEGVAAVLGEDMSADRKGAVPDRDMPTDGKASGAGQTVEWTAFSPPEGYAAAICRFR